VAALIVDGMSNEDIAAKLGITSAYVRNIRRGTDALGKVMSEELKSDSRKTEVPQRRTPSKTPVQDDSLGMIMVSGTDEQTQQMMMAHKVKRIATPDLLYIGMAMSRRLWGWPEMSETDFIDTIIYTLFDAAGVTLGAAYIKETNEIISLYGTRQLEEEPSVVSDESTAEEDEDDGAEQIVVVRQEADVPVVAIKEEPAIVDKADAYIDRKIDPRTRTSVVTGAGEQIPWPESDAEKGGKVSVPPGTTASDILRGIRK